MSRSAVRARSSDRGKLAAFIIRSRQRGRGTGVPNGRMKERMSGAEIVRTEQDRKALEDFVVGNEDLERLEALLDRFNIFEAIGVVRQELRHSDFLAYLFDPRGNHGRSEE